MMENVYVMYSLHDHIITLPYNYMAV